MGCGRSKPEAIAPIKHDRYRHGGNKRFQRRPPASVAGKLLTRDSPTRFFSSRKEDEAREDDDVGSEYYSPRADPFSSEDQPREEIKAEVETVTDGKDDRGS
ncbi:uncharacterized protein LOC144716659 [Wolffia australiana]